MNDTEAWILFERLADSGLPMDERRRLEAQVAAAPELTARLEAFRSMSEWPLLEKSQAEEAVCSRALQSLSADLESRLLAFDLGRLFPLFFGGAVAAALVLGLVNFWQFYEFADGTWDALFGLPAESIETALLGQL